MRLSTTNMWPLAGGAGGFRHRMGDARSTSPVFYDEHRTVREACGVYGIYIWEKFLCTGRRPRLAGWSSDQSGKLSFLSVRSAVHSYAEDERGSVIDDLIVYRIGESGLPRGSMPPKSTGTPAVICQHLMTSGSRFRKSQRRLCAALAVHRVPRPRPTVEQTFARALPTERNRVIHWDGLFAHDHRLHRRQKL